MLVKSLIKTLLLTYFIFGMTYAEDLKPLIKGLEDAHYKTRKASYKKCLALDIHSLKKLITLLQNSDDPELESISKKLQKECKNKQRETEQSLPKDINFHFDQNTAKYKTLSFSFYFDQQKQQFRENSIRLKSIQYGKRKLDGKDLRFIKTRQKLEGKESFIQWNLDSSEDHIFPIRNQEHTIKMTFETDLGIWILIQKFHPHLPEELTKSHFAFDLKNLHTFRAKDFALQKIDKVQFKNMLSFIKKHPDSTLVKTFYRNAHHAIEDYIQQGLGNKQTIQYLCRVIKKTKTLYKYTNKYLDSKIKESTRYERRRIEETIQLLK